MAFERRAVNRAPLIAAVIRAAKEAKGVFSKGNYRGRGVIVVVIMSTGRRELAKMLALFCSVN